jgi:UDP-N-acetylglucosamine--N-acetylmuramyl-(pentapeptide) pyrophosphoryl-undecaprenol N-acetylglucosamine transferase
MDERAFRLLLAGGGSGGSSTPLLAVADEVQRLRPSAELLYVGTSTGPERRLAERSGIPYAAVQAGKLRRYLDWQNVLDPFRVLVGIGQALLIIRRFRPDVGFGAGGFAAVPPLLACRLLGVPLAIHQQDVIPGLANRILAPFSSRITVSLEGSLHHFPRRKTAYTGNPVRPAVLGADRAVALTSLQLEPDLPTVLVTGGGTGALALNQVIADAAPHLVEFCQVLHVTGRGRKVETPDLGPRYRVYEFLVDEMPLALAAADLVVSRAGLATLTELAALNKPSIIVPMPDSHQEANARAFVARGGICVLEQGELTGKRLVTEVRSLLRDPVGLAAMGVAIGQAMPRDAAERIARMLLDLGSSVPISGRARETDPAARSS